ncbi:MAG TPA: flagellar biosynthesis anti-sigma factor FlgM [Acetomicrobium hydrogeniformans]|uniref:Negative regulator of flagellin synthesis n=2 Tax=Acetomicrobium hydrogeniformans TaxID=649746 RepID=A0A7V7BYM8_9BACT|nr:flagellar biosynthesis anti-sigma factor FlgM [Acetomicrobium hydrogeniformans]
MAMVEPIEPINRAHETEPVKKVRPRYRDVKGNEADGLEVSSFAKTLKRAVEEAKKIHEVREDRVEILRQQVQNGTYRPDLGALAKILYKAGFGK